MLNQAQATTSFKLSEFAAQINLSMDNYLGLVRYIIDQVMFQKTASTTWLLRIRTSLLLDCMTFRIPPLKVTKRVMRKTKMMVSLHIFSPKECPGLCWHRPGHSSGEKVKLDKLKNAKKLCRFAHLFLLNWTFVLSWEIPLTVSSPPI